MEHIPGYPSTPHWPWSETVHRDDSYHKDPVFFVGKEVVITEKLDGGNTCLARGEVFARSTFLPSHDGWFAEVRARHAYKTVGISPNVFTYGEDLYGIHSIEYDPLEDTYYVFNVRNLDYWYAWDEVIEHAFELDLRVAPVAFRGYFNSVDAITEWMRENRQKPSALGPEKEGFVMRLADGFDTADFSTCVCKYVRPRHVQTDQHWKENWQPAKIVGRK